MRQISRIAISTMAIGCVLFHLASCSAADVVTIVDKVKIEQVLKSIPSYDKSMPYRNVEERLTNLGLEVNKITLGALSRDEIRLSNGGYRRGDILYQFSTNKPNSAVVAVCPILPMFSLVKRGRVWSVQDRTGNFLINGYEKCKAP